MSINEASTTAHVTYPARIDNIWGFLFYFIFSLHTNQKFKLNKKTQRFHLTHAHTYKFFFEWLTVDCFLFF